MDKGKIVETGTYQDLVDQKGISPTYLKFNLEDISVKIYNSLTKQVEELKTLEPNKVKMYICGPTVYNVPTLGNLRTYINEDLLRRTLKYLGYQVDEVMNITDIEDKIIRDSKAQGIKYTELTSKYEKGFLDNLKTLNIETVEHMPHATDPKVIDKMIRIISDLLEKGIAYKSDDGSVYFSIDKYPNYGKLSGLENREVKAGARVVQDEYDKENAQDFALWKAAKEGEPLWEAPFGKGRPGWHIECTAMSIMHLGETIDIHGGGVDLVFPHHENEIAQSEAYTGKKFVNYWFHTGHLLVNNQRMGKSLGNFYTLEDLKDKFKVEINPLAFRLLCLQTNYRDSLNFTEDSIIAANNAYRGLLETVSRLSSNLSKSEENRVLGLQEEASSSVIKALENDLSIPKAFSIMYEFIKNINELGQLSSVESNLVKKTLFEFDQVFGLNLNRAGNLKDLPEKVNNKFIDYIEARKVKKYELSDRLREELDQEGWIIEDNKDSSILIKKY